MIGYYNEDPINPEVEDWKWMGIDAVKADMISFPKSIQFGSGLFLMSFTISLKIIKFRYFHNFYKIIVLMRGYQ
jgi:hypothetical protein